MQSLNSVLKLCLLFSVMNAVKSQFCLNVCRDLYWSQSHWAAIVGRAKEHSSCPLQAEVR